MTEFREGQVLAWDDVTGSNTIKIGSEEFSDCLNIAGTGSRFAVGDTVVLAVRERRAFILGRKL